MAWAQIRDGMKTRLATIAGLTAFDVEPENLPESDNAIVAPGDPLIEPGGHGGLVDVSIRVVVRCRRTTTVLAQDALDAYIWPAGASSVQAAVDGDPTLGGAVDYCAWSRVENYEIFEGASVLGTCQAEVMFKAQVTA